MNVHILMKTDFQSASSSTNVKLHRSHSEENDTPQRLTANAMPPTLSHRNSCVIAFTLNAGASCTQTKPALLQSYNDRYSFADNSTVTNCHYPQINFSTESYCYMVEGLDRRHVCSYQPPTSNIEFHSTNNALSDQPVIPPSTVNTCPVT
jgi:hypothetical protein